MSTQKQKLKGILSGKIDLINRSAFQFRIDCETLVEECERLHKDIKIIKNNIAALKPSNQASSSGPSLAQSNPFALLGTQASSNSLQATVPRWSFDQTPIEHRKEVVARLIEDIEREKRAMNDLKSEKGRLEKAGGSAM